MTEGTLLQLTLVLCITPTLLSCRLSSSAEQGFFRRVKKVGQSRGKSGGVADKRTGLKFP